MQTASEQPSGWRNLHELSWECDIVTGRQQRQDWTHTWDNYGGFFCHASYYQSNSPPPLMLIEFSLSFSLLACPPVLSGFSTKLEKYVLASDATVNIYTHLVWLHVFAFIYKYLQRRCHRLARKISTFKTRWSYSLWCDPSNQVKMVVLHSSIFMLLDCLFH